MTPVGNSQYQKIANTALILNMLREESASRIELAEALGLQASTVTYSTQRLIEQGIIVEGAQKEASGKGRRQKILSLNADMGVVAGVELMVSFYRITIVDICANIRLQLELSYTVKKSEDSNELYKARLNEALNRVEALSSPLPVLGVCVAIPGIVYPDPFTVEDCWTHGLKNVSFASFLSKYPYPVFFENDANCSALRFLLQKKSVNDFMYILFRRYDAEDLPSNVPVIGIGAGLVVDKKLYRGGHGRAGEFASNMAHQARSQVSLTNSDLSSLDVSKESVSRLTEEVFSTFLSSACLFDPSSLYIGGFLADEPFRGVLDEVLEKDLRPRYSEMLPYMKLEISDNSSFDPSIGAASYILDWLFRVPQVGITEEDERRFTILGIK